MIGIYKITNIINESCYIGKAVDIEDRWKTHVKNCKYEYHQEYLYRAMRKYGIDNFKFEVVEECSIDELNDKETYYIDLYKSYIGFDDCKGYNMTLGGEGSIGRKHSEKSKKIMSDKAKARDMSGENNPNFDNHALSGENHFNYGKHLSTETKNKMSNTRIERGVSKGGKNPSAKKVICEGVIYDCIKECAEFYDVNYSTLKCYINGSRKKPKIWVERGLDYYYE